MEDETADDHLICFCHCVKKSEILSVIRNGATTVAEIQSDTLASTGCGGCEYDVRELIDSELTRKAALNHKDDRSDLADE